MNLVRIEESFHTLKGDLGLRPVFHQIDSRIEAPRLHQLPRLLPASPKKTAFFLDLIGITILAC